MALNMSASSVGNIQPDYQRIDVEEDDDECSCPYFCDEFSNGGEDDE